MYRLPVGFLLSVSVAVSAFAEEGNHNDRLKGDYSFAISRVCAQARRFDADGRAAQGNVNQLTGALDRVATFDGQGNYSSVGRTMQVNTGRLITGDFPASESESTCSGTYQVNDDNSFTITRACTGTVLSGAQTGQDFVIAPGTITGRVQGKHLVIADSNAQPPTVVTFSGIGRFERLCAQSGSGVKIEK